MRQIDALIAEIRAERGIETQDQAIDSDDSFGR